MAEEKLKDKSDSSTRDIGKLASNSSNITSESSLDVQPDSIFTKSNSEKTTEVLDSLGSNERTPSTPSEIAVVPQLF